MMGGGRRSLPFQASCERLGLHREPDLKIKPGYLVNRVKLIYGITTIVATILVVSLTILSVTTQRAKPVAEIQATSFQEDDESSDAENSTHVETSAEALKYLVVSHPRRSKSIESYDRQPGYHEGYAQLETYRNSKRVHSVSDILRYMHGERSTPVKLSGTWMKTPANPHDISNKPPYHWDNLNKFKPTIPSEVNSLAGRDQTQGHIRFSNKVNKASPSVGPFKPLPEFPTHTQAIFHPYSLEGDVSSPEPPRDYHHRHQGIGTRQGSPSADEPFSVLLDIYPVPGATSPSTPGGSVVRGNKVVPLQVNIPPLSHVHIRKRPRPPPPPPSPTPQRMLLHLNLYPKNKKRNGGNKGMIPVHLKHPSADVNLREAEGVPDQSGEGDSSSSLSQSVYVGEKPINFTNTTISRIIKWCYRYEDELIKEKSVLFISVLRSFCKTFHGRDDSSSEEMSSEESEGGAYGRFAKLTQDGGEKAQGKEEQKEDNVESEMNSGEDNEKDAYLEHSSERSRASSKDSRNSSEGYEDNAQSKELGKSDENKETSDRGKDLAKILSPASQETFDSRSVSSSEEQPSSTSTHRPHRRGRVKYSKPKNNHTTVSTSGPL